MNHIPHHWQSTLRSFSLRFRKCYHHKLCVTRIIILKLNNASYLKRIWTLDAYAYICLQYIMFQLNIHQYYNVCHASSLKLSWYKADYNHGRRKETWDLNESMLIQVQFAFHLQKIPYSINLQSAVKYVKCRKLELDAHLTCIHACLMLKLCC